MTVNSANSRPDISPPQYIANQKDDFGEPQTSSWESSDAFNDEHVELQNLQPPQEQREIDVEANKTKPTSRLQMLLDRIRMLPDRIRNSMSPTVYTVLINVVIAILCLAGCVAGFVIVWLFISGISKLVKVLPSID